MESTDTRLQAVAREFDAAPVVGPTYRPAMRGLAAAIVVGLIGWGARLLFEGGPPSGQALLAGAALALALLWPMPAILLGRTIVDGRGIRQTGWMGREVEWGQIARVRFAQVPLSPRLLVSPGFSRVKVFYSGSTALDRAFSRIVDELTRPAGVRPPPSPQTRSRHADR